MAEFRLLDKILSVDLEKDISKVQEVFYVLYNNLDIVYIGQSKKGLTRAFSHRDKPATKIEIFLAPEDVGERLKLEKDLINNYKPLYNN